MCNTDLISWMSETLNIWKYQTAQKIPQEGRKPVHTIAGNLWLYMLEYKN